MGGLMGLALANPFWVWAAIGAALLAVEVFGGTGWLLWPAASAAVTAVLSLALSVGWPLQALVFAGLTIATTFVARSLWPPRDPGETADINDNIGRLIGHHGKTTHAFAGGVGRVFIDGKEWAAELDEASDLAVGASVEVTGVSGARLRVRPSH
ncbi:NfeD family protein [Phenylobacterium aquaticum]|uniref:NfeD family protein n=1 Tax=Phenylobacterium aquaticum TaxID=1763816 RepID=UPI0026ED9DBA|nr:NfeD family protein [Phenylobacterium aquaticum]